MGSKYERFRVLSRWSDQLFGIMIASGDGNVEIIVIRRMKYLVVG